MTLLPLTLLSIFIIGPGLQDRYELPKTLYLSATCLLVAYSLLTRHLRAGEVHLPLLGPIAAYLGVIALSYLRAVNPYEYAQQAGLDVMGVIFFWYAANVSRDAHGKILLILLACLIVFASIPNTMGNQGYKAIILAMGVPILGYYLLQVRHILVFLGKWLNIACVISLILFIFVIAGNVSPDASFYQTRLPWIKNTTAMIADHPVLGVGRGNWPMVYPVYARAYGDPHMDTQERRIDEVRVSKLYVNAAHNDWLQITAETGILGLGAFGWLMWGILRSVVWKDSMSVALWVSAVLFLGIALVHFPFQLAVPSMLFWALSGFLVRRGKV